MFNSINVVLIFKNSLILLVPSSPKLFPIRMQINTFKSLCYIKKKHVIPSNINVLSGTNDNTLHIKPTYFPKKTVLCDYCNK